MYVSIFTRYHRNGREARRIKEFHVCHAFYLSYSFRSSNSLRVSDFSSIIFNEFMVTPRTNSPCRCFELPPFPSFLRLGETVQGRGCKADKNSESASADLSLPCTRKLSQSLHPHLLAFIHLVPSFLIHAPRPTERALGPIRPVHRTPRSCGISGCQRFELTSYRIGLISAPAVLSKPRDTERLLPTLPHPATLSANDRSRLWISGLPPRIEGP